MWLRGFLALSLTSLLLVAFQNCGDAAPSAPPSELNQSSAYPPLQTAVQPASITAGQTASLSIAGGVPPYQAQIVQGTATISNQNTVTATAAGDVIVEVVDSVGQINQLVLTVTAAPAPPPPPPMVFNVDSLSGCVNGYCSCHTSGSGVPSKPHADRFCVYKGFKTSSAFSTRAGPVRQSQCHQPDGTSCFVNGNAVNLICSSITCTN